MKDIEKINNALKWLDELKSTHHKQGRSALGDVEQGFCCLGLGCYILNIDYNPNKGTNTSFTQSVGLLDPGGMPKNNSQYVNLIHMNDLDKKSFKQIYKVIKENPEQYFENEVAEGIKYLL